MENINQLECPVCFNEKFSSQIVYNSCCFQKVCDICDLILKNCVHCRTQLGDLRISFGKHSFDSKNSSILRLLPGDQTVESVIQTVRKFFPLLETKLTSRLDIKILNLKMHWEPYLEGGISNQHQYYLQNMRLPHLPLTNSEIDSWIISLLTSGKSLTILPLTKEEIHRKCNFYAARISSSNLSQEQVNLRIDDLMERGYCTFDEQTKTYKYQA